MNAEQIAAIRERSHDDETRGQIALIRLTAWQRLEACGWVQRVDAVDGLGCWDRPKNGLRLIHSLAREEDGNIWAHVSLSRRDRRMPSWEETADVWRLVYPDVYGVIVVAPESHHVNIAEVAHVWGNLSSQTVPDFTRGVGSI